MSDISNIDAVAAKKKISRLASKPQVSLEKTEKQEAIQKAPEMGIYDIELEQAEHAFALMTEIRQRLETAYNDISEK